MAQAVAKQQELLTIDNVRQAAERLAGAIARTPTMPLSRIGESLGYKLWAKLENLQHTSSFKERGALNRLKSLTPAEAQAGVIAMSAGNHAQGVAYHARRLGISATIVMPEGTPFTKVERTKSFGARVMLHGQTLSQAQRFAEITASNESLTFVHPYDDLEVIAGQGTIALEMLADMPELPDVLVVPIGGGGLISGIATATKALHPKIDIIGVQATAFPSMKQVLAGEKVVTGTSTLAEGIAVKKPGQRTREIIKKNVDDIVLVEETAIEQAICELACRAKLVTEGAGAVGLAAVMSHREHFAGKRVGMVLSGGNIDDSLLANLLLRGMVRDQRIIELRISLPDRPGALAAVARVIAMAGGNIVEVQHQRLFNVASAKNTTIDIVIETRDSAHGAEIVASLQEEGFPVERQ
jgi:threonine dehydratase